MRTPWLLLTIGALAVSGWLLPDTIYLSDPPALGYNPPGLPEGHPATSVEKDEGTGFRVDPSKPWSIYFSRGSGLYPSYVTIELNNEGRLTLRRMRRERDWKGKPVAEMATATLPPEAVARVLEAVKANELMKLEKSYSSGWVDGCQCTLQIRQGDQAKEVYFDNHFPESLVRFVTVLDETVAHSVGPRLVWRVEPVGGNRGVP
ncbi:MAG TPA: hypothetical protein VE988_03800 [Gemmataceae bacterium]|nr:hypothetical protein [Gemmataceae bacterium]